MPVPKTMYFGSFVLHYLVCNLSRYNNVFSVWVHNEILFDLFLKFQGHEHIYGIFLVINLVCKMYLFTRHDCCFSGFLSPQMLSMQNSWTKVWIDLKQGKWLICRLPAHSLKHTVNHDNTPSLQQHKCVSKETCQYCLKLLGKREFM